ncbi:MAG: isoleucine--tRNA ligase [Candidatus Berkiellales bacterium]
MSNTDYKNTLNLPTTAFPMRANLAQREPEMLAKWQAENLYQTVRQGCAGKQKFVLHMGPPYANGDIHIGHAVTTILKDIIIKFKTLSGFDAPLIPGWDCHGLPIEVNVEKKIGLANVDVTPKDFRQACRDYATSQVALQKASFIRLGILGDWQHPYLTMDHRYEAEVVRSIGKILTKNYIHPGSKPVHWCVNCGSALAEAEVEYQNKESPSLDVLFHIANPVAFLKAIGVTESLADISVVIWTTTPWTLPANQAVALHPDLEYVLVKVKVGQRVDTVVVLNELLAEFFKRIDCDEHEIIATFIGKKVEHLRLKHPFYDRTVPIVLGEHITVDAGTGAVHTAPGHGMEDYLIGLQYGLAIDNPVGNNGCFYEKTPLVGGLFVFKANDKIIEILRENNNLLHAGKIVHSYPHCWRHKTPIIFRATPQWFIGMENKNLRQHTLEAIDKVKWVPEWGQSRMRLMIEGRPDWCISRQRTWGVPLALVIHQETGELHPQMNEIIEQVAKRIEQHGIEAWYEFDIHELPFADITQYRKANDVLDVWFESGVSHEAVLKLRQELQFPADIYLEGSDQYRGWFQSALLSSVAMNSTASYRTVITHGFTVDAQGRKMSKSLGNVIAPDKVVKTLGADVLRLWVASTDYKNEIHVSDEILNRMSDAYRRIRNTMRFLLANLHGFTPDHLIESTKMISLDAWIVDCAARLQSEILTAYETYQFHQIYQKIHNFCVVELGSFYLDVIKDRQYTTTANGQARRSAQSAMYLIAHAITRWLAPILSFTAEEIWQHLPGTVEKTVFLAQWQQNLPRLSDKHAMNDAFWQKMIMVRECVNKALEKQRVQGKIGAPLDAEVTLYAKGELYEQLKLLKHELRFVLITSEAIVKSAEERGTAAEETDLPNLWLAVAPSQYEKCVRCWHHRPDVNQNAKYPEICSRCVTNISTQEGEDRHYA